MNEFRAGRCYGGDDVFEEPRWMTIASWVFWFLILGAMVVTCSQTIGNRPALNVENKPPVEEPVRKEVIVTAYEYRVTELNVVDADTVDAMLDLGFETYRKIRIRITGINAPEKTGSEKTAGIPAKIYVQWLLEKPLAEIRVVTTEWQKGKYGRTLGDVKIIFGDTHEMLSDILLELHMVNKYGGHDFDEQRLSVVRNNVHYEMVQDFYNKLNPYIVWYSNHKPDRAGLKEDERKEPMSKALLAFGIEFGYLELSYCKKYYYTTDKWKELSDRMDAGVYD